MNKRESCRLGGLAGIAAIARPLLARRRRIDGAGSSLLGRACGWLAGSSPPPPPLGRRAVERC